MSPDWFVAEVKDHRGESDEDKESEAERKQKAEAEAGTKRIHAEVKAQVAARPVESLTDPELFAKVSGAPVSIAEEMMIAYEGNLARMAGSTAKQMQKVSGIGKVRSEKIVRGILKLGKAIGTFPRRERQNHRAKRSRRPDDVENALPTEGDRLCLMS